MASSMVPFATSSAGQVSAEQEDLPQQNADLSGSAKGSLLESPNARVLAQRTSEVLRICANSPDFAVICAFLEKFHKELGLELPNFRHLQEWLSAPNESE